MYSSAELSRWTSAQWTSFEKPFDIRGISHDTRTLKPGDVYLAITGEQHDGHDFVGQAVEKGAVGVIVDRNSPQCGVPQLIVPDTMAALWQMAACVRREWSGLVIGITGSVGKTTVKELVAAVLAQKGTVSKTIGNWNNDIGLPLSILAADRFSDFFVFELGMNHPGEIDRLASLLRPDWALITNVAKVHTEFFQPSTPTASGADCEVKVLNRIAEEKAAILNYASTALLDDESGWFALLKSNFSGRVVTLTTRHFSIPQPGDHMAQNVRFAATMGLELGLCDEEIQAGLDGFCPAPMRWEKSEKDGVTFINDAYNASPLSMRAALLTFAKLPCAGRKFVVLGGMRELGEASAAEHRALGRVVDSLSFDGVITIGEAGKQIACHGVVGIEKQTAVKLLHEILQAGDTVLFKASRGERLETILDELKS